MFKFFIIFGVIILVVMVINANLIKLHLDVKTRYKHIDVYDQSNFLFLFLFFGIFTLPFLEYVKHQRKISYLKKRCIELKYKLKIGIYYNDDGDPVKELLVLERYLKLERIKRKTK